MWNRVVPSLTVCGLAAVLIFLANYVPANPPQTETPKEPPPKAEPAANAAAPLKLAGSRVTAVTVYPNSALVTREVDVPEGVGIHELTVTPLPSTTVDSSLYTEGADGIRVLTTRFRTRPIMEDTREDVRKLQDEIKQLQMTKEKLEGDLKAIQSNTQLITKLENFTTVSTMQATEKGALNSDSAISLAKYIMESRLERAKEMVALQQQLQLNQEKAEFAQRKLNELATGPARTERDAVVVVERINGGAGKVRLNYLVDGASWRPQYKFRAGKTGKEQVQVECLAALVQQSGEDWSSVKLVLSTAEPMLNAAPAELQVLQVTVVPRDSAPPMRIPGTMELEEQVKNLRSRAQKDFNEKKSSSGAGLANTAAALDQSWELLNPELALKRGCSLAFREGPSVAYHLNTRLTVPSRNDEQVLEITRIDMPPDYYYKAVPILTTHVYRLANLTNKSDHVLLPGEATMYIGSDFVGQMNVPLVAIGETFTVGFGVDPQLQVQRQMTDKARTIQGGNQALRYEYRILLASYKSERVKMQVWDRLPQSDSDAVGVSLTKAVPEVSKDGLYLRELRPSNLLRWDVDLDPSMSGEKALAINYEFKLELDRQMTISSFQTAAGTRVVEPPLNLAPPVLPAMPPMTSAEETKVKAAMAMLTPTDRRIAEAQAFCAIDQDSRLGTMGPILKVMCKGQPVFVCCKGCEAEARAHPDDTLVKVQSMMSRKR